MEALQQQVQRMRELGFDEVGILETSKIQLLPEVRQMCSANRCGSYGKRWCCPPGCGTLEECQKRVEQFSHALVMLTVTSLEDSFDFEGMVEGKEQHQALFGQAVDELRAQGIDILPLGAGGCPGCESCTYPDAPCRFPQQLTTPMEAYGMMVSDVCKSCGLHYCGANSTVTYVSMILLWGPRRPVPVSLHPKQGRPSFCVRTAVKSYRPKGAFGNKAAQVPDYPQAASGPLSSRRFGTN